MMRYVSIFSGIEAASVAWGEFGWEPVAFSEIEPFPCELLRQRFPNVPNLGDITQIDWKPYEGTVDLVVGGSPCQSFSIAGNREGLKGESGLMFEYIRAVREIMPRYFVWENVPGALSSEGGGAFKQLLSEMDELGYGLAWRVLDAQFFGVAQRRRRLFLVGCLGDPESAVQILFEPESLCWDYPSSRDKRKGLAAASGNGAEYTLNTIDQHAVCFQQNQRDEVRLMGGKGDVAGALSASLGMKNTNYICMASTQGHSEVDEDLCGTLTRRAYKDAPVICMGDGNAHASIDEDLSGTLKVGGEPPIIAKGVRPDYVVRRLMPLECERLQGFPDGWTDIEFKGKPASDSARYKALGNSMAVPVMRWIGERIEKLEAA